MNTRTGTYAHEYGHMIGYWDEDYIEGKFDINGQPLEKETRLENSIMKSPYGEVLDSHYDRIFKINIPKNE